MAVVGIDHRHIYTMAAHMVDAGGTLVAWATDGEPGTLPGWRDRFPDLPRRDATAILADPDIDLILTAAVPADRPALAVRAMAAGKHVLSDKPGALTLPDLDRIRDACARTGRRWEVDFSERYEVPSVTRATRLIRDGAIGRLVDITLIAPHRLNAATRPDWFWDPRRGGGILADIGSHQIEQVLHFAGADDATIEYADVDCMEHPPFQDRGRIAMRAGDVTGTILLHWFTPDGLPAWGDGRLFATGTTGTLEVRKYVDPAGRPGADHVILTDATGVRRFDASDDPLPFFGWFAATLGDPQRDHPFAVTRLAIQAQDIAERRREC